MGSTCFLTIKFIAPLQAQAEDVTARGAPYKCLTVNARDEEQEPEFRQLFDRTLEYEKLMQEIRSAAKEVRDLECGGVCRRA